MTTEKASANEAILNMRLPSDLHEQAKTRAKSRGVSLAGYVRQLVIEDLERANMLKPQHSESK